MSRSAAETTESPRVLLEAVVSSGSKVFSRVCGSRFLTQARWDGPFTIQHSVVPKFDLGLSE